MAQYFNPKQDPLLYKCPCQREDCVSPVTSGVLIARLDMMRARGQLPMRITSGPRCPWYNKSVGGVPDSAHLTGEAADVACPTSFLRWRLLAANYKDPLIPLFTRLGIGGTFLHVDVAPRATHPGPVVWTYPT